MCNITKEAIYVPVTCGEMCLFYYIITKISEYKGGVCWLQLALPGRNRIVAEDMIEADIFLKRSVNCQIYLKSDKLIIGSYR